MKQQTDVSEIPELKVKTHTVTLAAKVGETLASRIDTTRFSSWIKLKSMTARLLKLYERFRKGGNKSATLLPQDIENAEQFWIKESQKEISESG